MKAIDELLEAMESDGWIESGPGHLRRAGSSESVPFWNAAAVVMAARMTSNIERRKYLSENWGRTRGGKRSR